MRVTIHVEIGDYHNTSYKKLVLSWMREKYPHLTTFDFDSHSEATVMNYAIDLLKQGDEIIIILDQIPGGNGKPLLRFMDTLSRSRKKSVLIIYNGEYEVLSKMLSAFPKEKVLRNLDVPAQKEKIKEFFRLD